MKCLSWVLTLYPSLTIQHAAVCIAPASNMLFILPCLICPIEFSWALFPIPFSIKPNNFKSLLATGHIPSISIPSPKSKRFQSFTRKTTLKTANKPQIRRSKSHKIVINASLWQKCQSDHVNVSSLSLHSSVS